MVKTFASIQKENSILAMDIWLKVKNGKAVITIKIPKTNNRGIMYKYPKGKVTEIYEDIAYKGKVTFLGDTKYSSSSSTFKVTSMKKSKTSISIPLPLMWN